MASTHPIKARIEKHLAILIRSAAETQDAPEFAAHLKNEAGGVALALRELDCFGYAQVDFNLEWACFKAREHRAVELDWPSSLES